MDGKNKAKMNGDAMISNNYLNGCGVTNFWQPACIWAQGMKNISVINNEATNVPNHAIRLQGVAFGTDYWPQGLTNPSKDDYIFHVEFNHVHGYGLGIQNDFGGIYMAA